MNQEKVRNYFDEIANEFDNIYDNEGSYLTKVVNKLFRQSLYERVPITLKECGDIKNKKILDIGCGSGRLCYLLGKEGADVIGIDYSKNMIELANKFLSTKKINGKIKFLCCDFIKNFEAEKKYDISIALGVFDYLDDPINFLQKMKNVTKDRIIVSYPAKYAFQAPLRKIWLYTRNCPVFFYTEKYLEKIHQSVGITRIKIIKTPIHAKVPTGYIVIGNIN